MGMDAKLFGVVALLLLALSSAAFADLGYAHTRDSYYAVFDGEGDAITYAKITVRNSGPLAMDELRLTIPGFARIYEVMQQADYWREPVRVAGQGGAGWIEPIEDECPSYMECRRTPPKPPYGTPGLKRVKYEVAHDEWGNTNLRIRFDSLVNVDRESTLVIFYKARGYAQRDAVGVYNFNFRTIVDRETMLIGQASVTASVQPELSLAGVDSRTDYQMNEMVVGAARMAAQKDEEAAARSMESIGERMARFGGIARTGYNIDPGESFVVSGYFADAWWKLYIVPAIAALAVLGGAGLLAGKLIARERRNALIETLGYAVASGISALVMLAVFVVSVAGAQSQYSPLAVPLALLALFSGFASVVSFFAGSALAWRRHGVKHGALALAATLVLLICLAAIAAILLAPRSRPIYF